MFMDLNIKGNGELDIANPISENISKKGFSRYIYSLLTTYIGDIKVKPDFGTSVFDYFSHFVSTTVRDNLKKAIERSLSKVTKYVGEQPKVFVRIVGKGRDAYFLIVIKVSYLGDFLFSIKYGNRGIFYVEEENAEAETSISDENADILYEKYDNKYLNER